MKWMTWKWAVCCGLASAIPTICAKLPNEAGWIACLLCLLSNALANLDGREQATKEVGR